MYSLLVLRVVSLDCFLLLLALLLVVLVGRYDRVVHEDILKAHIIEHVVQRQAVCLDGSRNNRPNAIV